MLQFIIALASAAFTGWACWTFIQRGGLPKNTRRFHLVGAVFVACGMAVGFLLSIVWVGAVLVGSMAPGVLFLIVGIPIWIVMFCCAVASVAVAGYLLWQVIIRTYRRATFCRIFGFRAPKSQAELETRETLVRIKLHEMATDLDSIFAIEDALKGGPKPTEKEQVRRRDLEIRDVEREIHRRKRAFWRAHEAAFRFSVLPGTCTWNCSYEKHLQSA